MELEIIVVLDTVECEDGIHAGSIELMSDGSVRYC